ncbi:tetratricopeptide repeat protein [Undibacterium sp. RTI2.1]|uniref:tetratricopeptide repeat protein n=1 Tax=unclassified Undibacterium TaxID=2630295 RepID=UPI002B233933|nr:MULTISPECIES: tetratricopeptide repeat protein [unclassified Undibacterium]MEB0032925.1 tetratricopeptide repeat protein [Undibacterium sp. RTI2.1]MEB0118825.1 tetratricopeptide repeat protein [Undibacterium sp. RTI2.2]
MPSPIHHFRLASSLLVLATGFSLSACQIESNNPFNNQVSTQLDKQVNSAEIESTGMLAMHGRQAKAETQLRLWAEAGMPVAQRELALLYMTRPAQRSAAMALFEQAANGGDAEAAFQLGELYRLPHVDHPSDFSKAWSWYQKAAEGNSPNAALMLARMAKNGEGVIRDDVLAVKSLTIASDLGSPQAMFLLSNAYLAGQGVKANPSKARELLEMSAKLDYPVAIHALAMALQGGDMQIPKDDIRAGHLLKEATEERHNNWNNL